VTVLVVGESLVDGVERRSGVVDRHPGGSPANVAVGRARQQHAVTLATRNGTDADRDLLRRPRATAGVALAPGSIAAGRTSTATAVLDPCGAATYVFDIDWQLPDVGLAGVRHVHSGSIGAGLPPGSRAVQQLMARAARAAITTSYDPNLRPGLVGTAVEQLPVVERLVGLADVVKASDDDLAWLYADGPAGEPAAVAARWATLGPRLVVLTRGADGATAWVKGHAQPVELPAPRVDVVDTVGAGDAFMAGLLSGLLDAGLLGGGGDHGDTEPTAVWTENDVRPALQRALRVSSLTCARHGADPPGRDEL
jgi:fructokinase